MSTTTFSGPVNTQSVIGLNVYTVATAPDGVEGQIAYFSDGAAGAAILSFYDGSNWKRSDTGATIASS
tara:strand:+ start:231 stop:434 length:204 start_codon:yes stop_codon:yes gene_type:complete